MFRRILNWLAKNFGPAATPEEAGALKQWTEAYNRPLKLTPDKAAAIVDAIRRRRDRLRNVHYDQGKLVPLVELTPADVEVTDRSRLCKGGPLDGHWFANQDGSITDLFTLIRTDSDAPDKQCVVGYHDWMQRREGDVFGTYVAHCDGFDTFWIWTGWDDPLTSPPPASPPPASAS